MMQLFKNALSEFQNGYNSALALNWLRNNNQMADYGILSLHSELDESLNRLRQLGLPLHPDAPKNWDSLHALTSVASRCISMKATILDAGGEYYSSVLTALKKIGYLDLTAINLAFKQKEVRDGITYMEGDITNTTFDDQSVDYVICQSVLEHGVDLDKFFLEMRRVLKIGGRLFISTDYWHHPIETTGLAAFGSPVKVFDLNSIRQLVSTAQNHGIGTNVNVHALELKSDEKVVKWDQTGLQYTFVYIIMNA